MTWTKILGALLILLPFICLAVWVIREDGWRVMLGIYGLVALVVGIFGAGIWLWNK